MRITPQRMQAIAVAPLWLSVAFIGFVVYHSPQHMKYFLAMNMLVFAYTMFVLGSWIKGKLSE